MILPFLFYFAYIDLLISFATPFISLHPSFFALCSILNSYLNNWTMPNETIAGEEQAEIYRLSEILSIVPEFEGNQIYLGTFLTACYMASDDQR